MKTIKILQQRIITGLSSFVADITKGFRIGIGIVLALTTAGIFAVAVTGTFNTFSSGGLMKSADINANFASLKAAIEGIPTQKAMRLIYETDVTSATTSVNITGLDGDSDLTYEIIVKIMGAPNSTNIYLRLNNDSLSTNYGYKQMNFFNCAAVSTGSNDAEGGILIGQITTSNITQSKITLYAKSGVNRAFNIIFGSFSGGCNYGIGYNYAWWNNSASNITSIQIQSVLSNAIGPGSHIEVWARR